MKKGINIWSFPEMSLKEVFALASDAGFEGVELALSATGEITMDTSDEDLFKIKDLAKQYGLELYSLSCGMCWDYWLNADDEKERDYAIKMVKRQIDVAKILGCDTVLVIAGSVNAEFANPDKVVDYKTGYERSLQAVRELGTYASEKGIHVGLENVWNKFLVSPMEMNDFIDKVNCDYVGAYFDVGNVVFNGYPEHWIRILGKKIKKVHFKDYRKQAGGLHGFVDLLAGDVNYPLVVEELKKIGYDGWVSAEMIPNYKYYTETIIYNTSNAMDKILGR